MNPNPSTPAPAPGPDSAPTAPAQPLPPPVRQRDRSAVKREFLIRLRATGGNVRATARAMHVSDKTLHRWRTLDAEFANTWDEIRFELEQDRKAEALELARDAYSTRNICRSSGISQSTIQRWRDADPAYNTRFATALARGWERRMEFHHHLRTHHDLDAACAASGLTRDIITHWLTMDPGFTTRVLAQLPHLKGTLS